MIIVQVKDTETIDKALKRFKKKFERIKIIKEVRRRMYYVKPSIKRRDAKRKACYRQQLHAQENYG